MPVILFIFFIFFFNDTATTEIYTLSLHDALPISHGLPDEGDLPRAEAGQARVEHQRSEEHTSELQSHHDLVCRLLLEKKKKKQIKKQQTEQQNKVNIQRIIHKQRHRMINATQYTQ